MKNDLIPLSASRLKVFKECSWLYWCKYGPMKLPDKTNKGAQSGTCCHTIFECLLNPRHKKLHTAIVSEPSTIRNCPAVERYVRAYVQKNKMDEDSYKLIDAMIVVGLKYDFFCLKGNGGKVEAEHKFDIINENPPYRIMGFIDKMAQYLEKNFLRIVDYKSSKRQFAGDDLNDNVQAKIYSLAARTIYPDLQPIVEFIFLQFPEKPVQRLRFSEDTLEEFKEYLSQVSKKIQNFTLADATKNLAARKPMPKEGFTGPLMCGFNKFPGEKKLNGEPKWGCVYKFPFDYFSLCNENDDVMKSSFEEDLIPNETKGEYVIKKHYLGCPHWNKKKK